MSSLADTFEHLVPVGPRLTVTPVITPTIAPLGRDRLIPVRNVQGREVVVRGGATGREYRFARGSRSRCSTGSSGSASAFRERS